MKKLSKKWKFALGIVGAAGVIAGTTVAAVACGTTTNYANQFVGNNSTVKLDASDFSSLGLENSKSIPQASESALNAAFTEFLDSSSVSLPSGTTASQYSIDWSGASDVTVTTSGSSSTTTFTAPVTYTSSSQTSTSTNPVTFSVQQATASEIASQFVSLNPNINLGLFEKLPDTMQKDQAINSADQGPLNDAFKQSSVTLPMGTKMSNFAIDWTGVKSDSTTTDIPSASSQTQFIAYITYTPSSSGSAGTSTTAVTFTISVTSQAIVNYVASQNSTLTLKLSSPLATALSNGTPIPSADKAALNSALQSALSNLPKGTSASEYTIDFGTSSSPVKATSTTTFSAPITYKSSSGTESGTISSSTIQFTIDASSK